ncbi:MAG: hypothetical protein ACREPX_12435 [Rhodanobacteraceae bacterium]
MDGWARFGASLGGNSDNAFMQGAQQSARLEDILLQARERRDAEVGRQTAAQQAFDGGDNDLGNAILRGANPNEISNYRLGTQKLGWGNDAMTTARAPGADLGELNRMLMVMDGKPQDLTKIEDHTILNPMLTPDAQHLQTNEIGNAMIATEGAQQGAYHASARAADALARERDGVGSPHVASESEMSDMLAQANELSQTEGPEAAEAFMSQQFDPSGMYIGRRDGRGGRGRGGAAKPSSLTETEIKGAFGKLDADGNLRIDPMEYRRFLAWQHQKSQTDPRFRDSRFAAQAYSADMHGIESGGATSAPMGGAPAPVADEPSLVDRFTSLFDGGEPDGSAPAPVDPASQKTASDAARPATKADYDALPSGSLYVDPGDGTLRRKK